MGSGIKWKKRRFGNRWSERKKKPIYIYTRNKCYMSGSTWMMCKPMNSTCTFLTTESAYRHVVKWTRAHFNICNLISKRSIVILIINIYNIKFYKSFNDTNVIWKNIVYINYHIKIHICVAHIHMACQIYVSDTYQI